MMFQSGIGNFSDVALSGSGNAHYNISQTSTSSANSNNLVVTVTGNQNFIDHIVQNSTGGVQGNSRISPSKASATVTAISS